ncbi:MAG: CapA family protein, partial [Candidatus Spyradocola sp.]
MLYTRNKPHKRRPNWRNILLTALCVALLATSVTLLVRALPGWLNSGDNSRLENSAPPNSPTPTPSATPAATPSSEPSQSPDADASAEPSASPSETPQRGSGTQSVTLGAVGEILLHAQELQAASNEAGGYDFENFFSRIQAYTSWQDFTIGTLSATVGSANYDAVTAPAALLTALSDAGMDVLNLAGPHALDRDIAGAQETVKAVKDAGLQGVGVYSSGSDYIAPLILEKDDLRIAVLSYTESTLETPDGAADTVKYLDETTFDNDMKQIEGDATGVDFVVVCVHWDGDESALTDSQKNWAQVFADRGVDVVLGTHANLPQTLTYVQGQEGNRTLVAYGLGNFVGPTRSGGKDAGYILSVTLTKNFDSGETSIDSVTYAPTWVLKYSASGKYSFEVLSAVEYSGLRYQNM